MRGSFRRRVPATVTGLFLVAGGHLDEIGVIGRFGQTGFRDAQAVVFRKGRGIHRVYGVLAARRLEGSL